MEKAKTENRFRIKIIVIYIAFFAFYSSAQEIKNYFTSSEIKTANTAISTRYLDVTEKGVYMVLNLARLYPAKFLNFYKDYIKENHGDFSITARNSYYKTLWKDLSVMKPVGALYPDKNMYELAKCWALESGKKGVVGHNRKNCPSGFYAECCTYGNDTPVEIVMSFLIDDGVKSLGHRKICLSSSYSVVGVSKQAHKTYGTNTVLDFTYTNETVRN